MSTPPPDLTAIAASNGAPATLARHVLDLSARLAAVERDPLAVRDRLASVERRLAAVEGRDSGPADLAAFVKEQAAMEAEVVDLRAKLADETQRRVNAESHRDTAVAEVDRLKADLARLTKPGPASDEELRALHPFAAKSKSSAGVILSQIDLDWMRAVYALGLAHGRAEQATPTPTSGPTDEEIARAVVEADGGRWDWIADPKRQRKIVAITAVVRPMLAAAAEERAQREEIRFEANITAIARQRDEAIARAQRAEQERDEARDLAEQQYRVGRANAVDEMAKRAEWRKVNAGIEALAQCCNARERTDRICELRILIEQYAIDGRALAERAIAAAAQEIDRLRTHAKVAAVVEAVWNVVREIQHEEVALSAEAHRLNVANGSIEQIRHNDSRAQALGYVNRKLRAALTVENAPESDAAKLAREMREGTARFVAPAATPSPAPTLTVTATASQPPSVAVLTEDDRPVAVEVDGVRVPIATPPAPVPPPIVTLGRGVTPVPERGEAICVVCGAVATAASSGGPNVPLRVPHCGGSSCLARIDALWGASSHPPPARQGGLHDLMFGADPLTMRSQADAIDGRNCDGRMLAATLRNYAAIVEKAIDALATVGAAPTSTPAAVPAGKVIAGKEG